MSQGLADKTELTAEPKWSSIGLPGRYSRPVGSRSQGLSQSREHCHAQPLPFALQPTKTFQTEEYPRKTFFFLHRGDGSNLSMTQECKVMQLDTYLIKLPTNTHLHCCANVTPRPTPLLLDKLLCYNCRECKAEDEAKPKQEASEYSVLRKTPLIPLQSSA